MEEKFMIIINIALIAIFVFAVWNNILYSKMIKLGTKAKNPLPDEKYFELKYKIQSLITAFSIIVGGIGILGYTSYLNLQNEMMKHFETQLAQQNKNVDSLIQNRINFIMHNVDSVVKDYIGGYTKVSTQINKNFDYYNSEVSKINTKMNFKGLYITNSLKLPLIKGQKTYRVIYKDFGLPISEKIPTLLLQSKDGSTLKLLSVEKTYFDLEVSESNKDFIILSLVAFDQD
jgi:hypothetical protein